MNEAKQGKDLSPAVAAVALTLRTPRNRRRKQWPSPENVKHLEKRRAHLAFNILGIVTEHFIDDGSQRD
jgi:hypothetical protein